MHCANFILQTVSLQSPALLTSRMSLIWSLGLGGSFSSCVRAQSYLTIRLTTGVAQMRLSRQYSLRLSYACNSVAPGYPLVLFLHSRETSSYREDRHLFKSDSRTLIRHQLHTQPHRNQIYHNAGSASGVLPWKEQKFSKLPNSRGQTTLRARLFQILRGRTEHYSLCSRSKKP